MELSLAFFFFFLTHPGGRSMLSLAPAGSLNDKERSLLNNKEKSLLASVGRGICILNRMYFSVKLGTQRISEPCSSLSSYHCRIEKLFDVFNFLFLFSR